MIKTFTPEKLLQYLYNELPAKEQAALEQTLLHDPELAAHCADLLLAQRTLTAAQVAPGEAVTQNILRYSRTFLPAS